MAIFDTKATVCRRWAEISLVGLVILVDVGLVTSRVSAHEGSTLHSPQTDLRTLRCALDSFQADVGRYPTADEGLDTLLTEPAGVRGWHGPYVKRFSAFFDLWNNRYVYEPSGVSFTVRSLGADGQVGGDGFSADIEG